MGRDDWYRNTDWNEQIESAFFAKLRRARNKSQYVRIQACTLTDKFPHVALRLLDEYFKFGDDFDMAQAYVDSAKAFLALDKPNDAINSYEAALAREAEFSRLKTQAYIDLPYLIAAQEIQNKYERALELLYLHRIHVMLPVDRYKWNAAMAIILSSQSDLSEAIPYARAAIDAAQETESGFRYHPKIGLAKDKHRDSVIFNKLKKLAS